MNQADRKEFDLIHNKIDDIKNDFEIGFRAARKPRLVSNQ